jgi:serine/threonine-protein kinase
LYELTTGSRPFTGENSEAVKQQILTVEPVPPRKIRPQLDRNIEAIILECLKKPPRLRYASAEALADDLHNWLEGTAPRVRPEGSWNRGRRLVRRYPRWFVAGLCLASLAFAVAAWSHYSDPNRVARGLQAELAQGREAVLIGPTGEPRWSHWQIPGLILKRDDVFRMQSWTTSLLELLPGIPIQRFRFAAEISHRDGKPQGEVGIYFGHHETQGAHFFGSLTFHDVEDLATVPGHPSLPGNPARFYIGMFHARNDSLDAVQLSIHYFKPAGRSNSSWRRLVIDVTPTSIQPFWDDNPEATGSFSPVELRAAATRLLSPHPELAGLDADIDTQGGLGLYLSEGEASFRNVVIQPLP